MELGIPELLIILVIVVLLWGPGRLSKIGGELGAGINAFRKGLTDDPNKKDEDETTETSVPAAKTVEQPVGTENKNGKV